MGLSSSKKTTLGFPLIVHYNELYNYFTIYYNVLIIEIKSTMNTMLDYTHTQSCVIIFNPVLKGLGTTGLDVCSCIAMNPFITMN